MNISEQVKCQCGVRAANECRGAWEPGCDLGANPDHVAVADETPEQVIASLTTAPEEPGFVRLPRTAAEAECMAKLGMMWLEANAPEKLAAKEPLTRFCPGCGSLGPVDAKYRDCCPDGGRARMIPESLAQRCHDLFLLALEAVKGHATQPVEIHQWRKRGTSMWWDGIPDHADGCGPYETRTLYAGAAPAQAEPAARTAAQIVQQTEELAAALMEWRFGGLLAADYRTSKNPRGLHCWQMACKAQEILTATDPMNAVAELNDGGAA